MVRIDENTFIDDTLVTCAEYQLFIDELRDQGKYYQPDQWISYKFPTGQAREPILGVRFTDAKAFCEWLAHKSPGEWSYRLPISIEAKEHRLKNHIQSSLGYWCVEQKGEIQFAWIDTIPLNPRKLNYERVIERAHEFVSTRLMHKHINVAGCLRLDNASVSDEILQNNGDARSYVTRALDRYLGNGRTDRHGRLFRHGRSFAHSRVLAIENSVDYICRTKIIGPSFASGDPNYKDLAIDRFFDRVLGAYNPRAVDYLKSQDRDNDIDQDIGHDIDIYLDLYTLQERIAGRSPAFEGIRLVKERVKI